jgi:hypothetical protein
MSKSRTFALIAMLLGACGGGGGRADVTIGPMPQGGSYTGVWFSPQYGEMHMVQTGQNVIGEYTKDERHGRIQGTVNGNVMRFEWNEEREMVGGLPQVTRGRGYFRYEIGQDERHNLLGEWGLDDNEIGGGDWNAYRMRNRRPQLSTDSQGGATGEDGMTPFESEGGGDTFDSEGDDSGGGDSDSGDSDSGGDALDDLDL